MSRSLLFLVIGIVLFLLYALIPIFAGTVNPHVMTGLLGFGLASFSCAHLPG